MARILGQREDTDGEEEEATGGPRQKLAVSSHGGMLTAQGAGRASQGLWACRNLDFRPLASKTRKE